MAEPNSCHSREVNCELEQHCSRSTVALDEETCLRTALCHLNRQGALEGAERGVVAVVYFGHRCRRLAPHAAGTQARTVVKEWTRIETCEQRHAIARRIAHAGG